MQQYRSPHPGQFIKRVYIEAKNLDSNIVVHQLQIDVDEFTCLINGSRNIMLDLASKLPSVLGCTQESWLSMQRNYDLSNR